MKPPPMPSGDLRRIVIDTLAGSAVQVWKRHTYDSGPYEVTMLRDSTERIARAVEAARDAQWAALLADAVAQERERCARVCDDLRTDYTDGPWEAGYLRAVIDLADAIRAQTDSKG